MQMQTFTVQDLSNIVRHKVREFGYGGNKKFAKAYGHDPSVVCKVICGKLIIPKRLARMLGFVMVTKSFNRDSLFVKSSVGENTDVSCLNKETIIESYSKQVQPNDCVK